MSSFDPADSLVAGKQKYSERRYEDGNWCSVQRMKVGQECLMVFL